MDSPYKKDPVNPMISDPELKNIIKTRLPEAGENPWFVNRVMNRLPDKPDKRVISWAERSCYIIASLILVGIWVTTLVHTYIFGLTTARILIAALVPALSLVCAVIVAAPSIRKIIHSL